MWEQAEIENILRMIDEPRCQVARWEETGKLSVFSSTVRLLAELDEATKTTKRFS